MQVIHDFRQFPQAAKTRGGVLSVGNFDGVHIGHAAMLSAGRAEATRRGVPFAVMTFDPHPGAILRPGTARPPLTTLDQRIDLLGAFSPDVLIVVPTTREFLSMTAEDFLRTVVQDAIGASLMVEGPSFTFGQGAKGNVALLAREGAAYGIELLTVPTQQVTLSDLTQVNVSSSLTRWLVSQGRVADAAKCLGRAFTLRGEVVKGEQRGRAIGFPTANIKSTQLLPAAGVYAGRCTISAGSSGGAVEMKRAAISIGTNPTFAGAAITVEAYLLDYTGDLYGQTVELSFHRWLRDMWAFGGVEPLVKQIEKDVAATRDLVSLEETP
jgi:riboflavin kinase/FMN adenylyltransferase